MEPVIAKPHSPDNKARVRDVQGTKLDRAYIGSCTGGKMTDFRAAAAILQGKEVKIDTFVVPATTEVARGLDTEMIGGTSLRNIFLNAGAKIGDASCAACLGGPSDTFGRLNTADQLHQHDQPQLPRPHGPQGGRGVPGQPADRRGECPDGDDRGPAGGGGVNQYEDHCPTTVTGVLGPRTRFEG